MQTPSLTHSVTSSSQPPRSLTEEETIDLGQYWRVIRRHKFGIFSISLMCVLAGVLAALNLTPIFKAETKLIADPVQPNLDTRDQFVNTSLVFLFYETQYEIIGSQNIAEKVVDKLDLVARYKADQAANKEPNSPPPLYEQVKKWLAFAPDAEPLPPPSDETLRLQLAQAIQAKLTVEGGKQSQIIRIGYEDPDPQLAAAVANAIAESYVEFGLNSRLSGAKKTASWLNEQLGSLKAKLKKSEDALQAYQKSQGMVDSTQQERLSGTRLATLTTELIKAQTKRSESEIRYNQIRKKSEGGDYESLTSLINSPTVTTLAQEVNKLARSVQELSERYGEKHPKMTAARSDLGEAKKNLAAEINKTVDSIRKEYQAALDHEKELNTLVEKEKRDLGSIKGSSFELSRLEREVANNQKIYESFLSRFQEANVSEEYDASNVQIIDAAKVPDEPYKPNKPRFVLIALVLGLFLGLLFAFLREHLDNTFKTTEDLELKLKLPTLGIVPAVKLSKISSPPHRQVLNDPRSLFAENINTIRTGLLFANIDNPPRTILVTSATAMEGKSTLAANLAASLSQLDRTLLLEVDLRKPTVAQNMGIKPTPGVAEQALNRGAILLESLSKVGGEESNLYAIPAGSYAHNPLELLSSETFKHLLDRLKELFPYIVLDGPPMLAVSDAAVIGHLVDSVVVAVKAESTKIEMAREAINRLHKANVTITGTVLCQADAHRMNYYGDHYTHYYDASYYGYREAAKEGA